MNTHCYQQPTRQSHDYKIVFGGRARSTSFFHRMLIVLVEAEKRLTRTAQSEKDIDVLQDVRKTIAQADPHGHGKRFIKG